VYEWSSDKSKNIKKGIEGQSVKTAPWLVSRLKMGKAIIVPSIDDLPKQARREKEFWKRLSVRSFVAIPLVRGRTILGYFGFDGEQPGKIWKEEDIRLLRLVGEMLVNILQLQDVRKKKMLLQAQLAKQFSLNNIVGKHGKMEELFRLVHKVAPGNTTVMIYGETGVGKEQIARAIHQLSPRSAAPMYAINCAAIPEHLLESELFGYEQGAFTGAHARKKGILEEASGSTLFLDEVGDLSRPLQAKILRMLQEREIQRLGGTNRIRVDLRVISATHQDLTKMMTNGSFREDLYYRLNTFPIIVPPLRERTTDIPLLVNHFLKKYKKEGQSQAKKISIHALESLLVYPWPGNVRELESVIERAVILAEGEMIHQEDLPQEVLHTLTSHPASRIIDLPDDGLNIEELEKYLLARALEKSGGVIARAARLLGLTYRTFQYRMIKFGLTDYTK
jgi:transcriptional regulator with GAF, ATPase, and Fis domain